MYGAASYTATVFGRKAQDSLVSVGKEAFMKRFTSFIGVSPLKGWNPGTGVQCVFAFLNSCSLVVDSLQKISKGNANEAFGGRRLVIITNIGASNVKGGTGVRECLSTELPYAIEIFFATRSTAQNIAIIMNQPITEYVIFAPQSFVFNKLIFTCFAK